MMKFSKQQIRRIVRARLLALALGALIIPLHVTAFPSKPIKILVPNSKDSSLAQFATNFKKAAEKHTKAKFAIEFNQTTAFKKLHQSRDKGYQIVALAKPLLKDFAKGRFATSDFHWIALLTMKPNPKDEGARLLHWQGLIAKAKLSKKAHEFFERLIFQISVDEDWQSYIRSTQKVANVQLGEEFKNIVEADLLDLKRGE